MPQINLIAALDEAGGLGLNNQLLAHLPADLQHFKRITLGKTIIMGRATYESIGNALPGRTNIILSRSGHTYPDATVVNSLEQALAIASTNSELFIIGGAQLFRETIDRATRLYLTKIHHHFVADVFFPKVDETIWSCLEQQFRPHDEKNKYDMTFSIYERIK